ncbi:MAG: Type 1 glutamine amidotransferase-like domain-containing protein [Candidatus Paceibacterota bacterium]|jgi:dipeptidase E
MQTILLTSSGKFLTDGDLSFLPKPITQMKIAYITTASKGVSDISYLERHRKRMKELNYNFKEIDIEGKNEQELEDILKNKEIIHVEGGNTFYLLKVVLESGFDKVIKELVRNGIIYIGSSAGSYIACPTIEMATWKHQDKYNHYGITDFTALNLVPFLVTAHYKPEYQELLKEKIKTSKYPVRILTDEQAILVQDEEVKLVGNGKEIKL